MLIHPQKETPKENEVSKRSSVRERTSDLRSADAIFSCQQYRASKLPTIQRSSKGERTWHGRSEKGTNLGKEAQKEQLQPKFAAKKYEKSMKAATKLAVRSADRKHSPILFQIKARNEQLAASEAVLEHFENGERRDGSVKDAQNEPLSVQRRALLFRRAAGLLDLQLNRSACFGLLLADVALKENELERSGCFGERQVSSVNSLTHLMSYDKNAERRKDEILNEKRFLKNQFYFRISGFCLSPLYGMLTVNEKRAFKGKAKLLQIDQIFLDPIKHFFDLLIVVFAKFSMSSIISQINVALDQSPGNLIIRSILPKNLINFG
jgi:hypothetical protein